MKTTTFVLAFFAMAIISCNSQHRLEHWKTEKISIIQVNVKQPSGSNEKITINDKSEVKKVMDFLLRTTFEPYTDKPGIDISKKDSWAIRLIF